MTRQKRPHTKSRWGCVNCRARRVKCQETKPACENCIYRDMECVYPSRVKKWLDPAPRGDTNAALVSPSQDLSATPFRGDDLRFFHHFLMVAHPHLPYGSESSWTTKVPRYAHEYPYLMHAILSLGATHYALVTPNGAQYCPTAIVHRGKALKALGAAVANPNATITDMDVILATCYALVFQAYHMNDGLVDFAVMVRGCGIITSLILQRYQTSQIFELQTETELNAIPAVELPDEPLRTPYSIEALLAAIDALGPLLQSPAHRDFSRTIQATLVAMRTSLKRTFVRFTHIYAVWYQMGNREFLTFIAPANHVSRALFLYFLAVEVMMQPIFLRLRELRGKRLPTMMLLVHQWADTIYRELPASMREYVQLPMQMIAADREMRGCNSRGGVFSDLHTRFSELEARAWLGCI